MPKPYRDGPAVGEPGMSRATRIYLVVCAVAVFAAVVALIVIFNFAEG
jgi:hypothetical protein